MIKKVELLTSAEADHVQETEIIQIKRIKRLTVRYSINRRSHYCSCKFRRWSTL